MYPPQGVIALAVYGSVDGNPTGAPLEILQLVDAVGNEVEFLEALYQL